MTQEFKLRDSMHFYPKRQPNENQDNLKYSIRADKSRLHLGHLTCLLWCRKLVRQGKKLTIVFETFSLMENHLFVPDKKLSVEEIVSNCEKLKEQVWKVLGDVSFFEDHLLFGPMEPKEFSRNIIKNNRDLCSAMTSVHLKTGIELGGEGKIQLFSDTRRIQRSHGMPTEKSMICPTISGVDGQPMDEKNGNAIFLTDSPEQMRFKMTNIGERELWLWHDEFVIDHHDTRVYTVEEDRECLIVQIVESIHDMVTSKGERK